MESSAENRIKEISNLYADLTNSGVQLYQIYDMTRAELEIMYEMAHNLYLEERYKEALETMQTLCWLKNNNVIYWKALASVEEKLGNYQGAENACSMIVMLEPDNHQAYLDLAGSAGMNKHYGVARKSVEIAQELALEQKKGSRILALIDKRLAEIKRQTPSSKEQ